jgi:hypothetical protein
MHGYNQPLQIDEVPVPHDKSIVVRSLTDGLDSSTDCGRMVMGILAHVAGRRTEPSADQDCRDRDVPQ